VKNLGRRDRDVCVRPSVAPIETRERASQLEAAAYDFARAKGMKIYELAPKELAEWRACSSNVLTDYLNRSGELTQQLMNAYGKLRTEPCCSAGPSASAFEIH
jgi:TRAP-type C4-dicarboxylate transport system substrate-binding protein